jgi:preprotein translocase subunit YajC
VVAHWWLTRFVARSGPRPTHRPTRKIIAVMNQMVVFLPLLIVLAAFMFFASRRQKRAMQATIDLHESLRVGDRVHTTSGLQGTITHITDDTVDLEIAPGVVTTWMKLAVRDRIEPELLDTEAEEADDLADDPERLPKD